MYLKRLEIQGFKSFANHTVLDFLPAQNSRYSITAVVGPNGAGKSNITDAIRWVMGETSLKNLRGKKSEDVIFNGSRSRAALSLAAVTMVLDNSGRAPAATMMAGTELDSALATILAGSEISLTRRLYRSGESEYLINNLPVRLLEVHLLLARAQFAEHSYSIVSQGTIDRLLMVSPSERKDFFDEASGIKEYQIKEHQAALKLNRAQDNMAVAESLRREVEPRLKILARQVKKLEEREQVEGKLRAAQERYYYTLYRRAADERERLETDHRRVGQRIDGEQASLVEVQTELALLAKSSSRQEGFTKLATELQHAGRAKNELTRQLAVLEGQLQVEYRVAGAQSLAWLEDKRVAIESGLAEAEEVFGQAERQAAAAALEAEDLEQRRDIVRQESNELKIKISRLIADRAAGESEERYRRSTGLAAVEQVKREQGRLGRVYGLVAELAEAPEEYALALAVAAGAHLTSLVVADETVARKAIEFLRAGRHGVATFLPLTTIQPRVSRLAIAEFLGRPGVLGKAIDLLSFDARYASIFSFIFGDTLVVEDLRVAQSVGVGHVRMVTLAGDLSERNGSMRGGFRERERRFGFNRALNVTANESVANIQGEVKATEEKLAAAEARLGQLDQELLRTRAALETGRAGLARQETARQSLARELSAINQEYKLATANPAEYRAGLVELRQKAEQVRAAIAAKEKKVIVAEAAVAHFNEQEEIKQRRVFALQEKLQATQQLLNGMVDERTAVTVALAKLDTKLEDLGVEVEHELRLPLSSLAERLELTAASEAALNDYTAQIEKLKYQLSLIGGIDQEVVEEYKLTKERYDFLTAQLNDLAAAMSDLQKLIAELAKFMKQKRAAAFKQIRKEFQRYFAILFDGGTADLEEIYGDNAMAATAEPEDIATGEVIESGWQPSQARSRPEKILTGIEVLANPPGKKVKYLAMLSGGERTLTSVALISAILSINPSPFVVLDEVEAALDEQNTLRFTRIIGDLARHSQFIIITHNRVTMHAADALYGVVMGGDGVSKLLSVKLSEAEKIGEEAPSSPQPAS